MDIFEEPSCPVCDGFQPTLLGQLGAYVHLRCRDCGYEYHYFREASTQQVEEPA